ncbi:MAG: 50S ribosomal protein L11 methyltransferase [Pseudomonadota bacterium]
MNPIQARFLADEATAKRYARLIEPAFEDDGFPISCFATAESGPWAVEILFFDLDRATAESRLRAILADVFDSLSIEIEDLPDRNWVAVSLAGLAPVSAGRFLVHGSHDRAQRRGFGHNIEIDANLAFGTGHHGSTRGCLLALDTVLKSRSPQRMLDLGCGSGVLAFACALATRRSVLASDIDPVAAITARQNARINGVASRVDIIAADGFRHPAFAGAAPFDLVLANIIARPLTALAPDLARHLAPSATLILSGLRPEDGRRVLAAYRPYGLVLGWRLLDAGWLTLVLERHSR